MIYDCTPLRRDDIDEYIFNIDILLCCNSKTQGVLHAKHSNCPAINKNNLAQTTVSGMMACFPF